MNRSPLFYPLNRGGDADGGGAADLQTDIMRFMAILALCLVAVFALVQSLPQAPTSMDASALPTVAAERREMITAPAAAAMRAPRDTAPPVINARPAEARSPENSSAPENQSPARRVATLAESTPPSEPNRSQPIEAARAPALPEPPANVQPDEATAETPAEQATANAQPDETTAAAPAEAGLSLRFASDIALTRLVANNAVGLYAINPQRALRMSVNRGTYSFWPASAPNQFHEMDPGTVPDAVVIALRRSGTLGADPAVKWGVTLPMTMRQQLNGYLAEQSSGALVIEADGQLRLEQ